MKNLYVLLALVLVLAPATVVAQGPDAPITDEAPSADTAPMPDGANAADAAPAADDVPAQDLSLTAEGDVCTAVVDRQPVGAGTSFGADVQSLCFWTKVVGQTQGEATVKHLWSHAGEVKAEMALKVKGSPWRTWSKKSIPSDWTGAWEVKALDEAGNVLKTVSFTVEEGQGNPAADAEPAEDPAKKAAEDQGMDQDPTASDGETAPLPDGR
jgi:hypothetical protein